MDIISKNPQETENIAQNLAKELKNGDILALYGDLGAGKSLFARALIRTIINDQNAEVPSPTFTLVQTYESPKGQISHFDCYRLEDPEEIYEIGWEESLNEGIVILEWPSKLEGLLPNRRLDITLTPLQNETEHRHITIKRIE